MFDMASDIGIYGKKCIDKWSRARVILIVYLSVQMREELKEKRGRLIKYR